MKWKWDRQEVKVKKLCAEVRQGRRQGGIRERSRQARTGTGKGQDQEGKNWYEGWNGNRANDYRTGASVCAERVMRR